MLHRRSRPLSALAFVCLVASGRAEAQETTPRIDVTGSVVTTFFDANPMPRRAVGASGSVDLALPGRLWWTTEALVFPREELSRFQAQGGRTAQVATGLRSMIVEDGRFALEVRISLGLIHFTRAITSERPSGFAVGGRSHLTFDGGLALRYRLSRHADLVLDTSTVAYAFRGQSDVA